MKCAFITKPGAPEVLTYGELPLPEVLPKQVLVKVGAAGLNPIDTYIRAGNIPMPVKFPYIPGCDLAGTVEQVGAEVSRFKTGDRVWGSNQGLFQRQGTFAEYAAVDEEWLYHTPQNMTDEQAAAGALTGMTAQLGLFHHAGLQAGDYVFINGGSGGVGSSVIQYAVAQGAHVIATAGSEEKRQLCRDLGAEVVLDYRSLKLEAELRAACEPNGGFNLWWETQREPNLPRAISMMKKRGRIIVMAGREAELQFKLGPFYTNDLKLIGFAMFNATPEEQRVCAERMNKWFSEGKWHPVIGKRYPLSQAAAAHRFQEVNTLAGHGELTGKIVVIPE